MTVLAGFDSVEESSGERKRTTGGQWEEGGGEGVRPGLEPVIGLPGGTKNCPLQEGKKNSRSFTLRRFSEVLRYDECSTGVFCLGANVGRAKKNRRQHKKTQSENRKGSGSGFDLNRFPVATPASVWHRTHGIAIGFAAERNARCCAVSQGGEGGRERKKERNWEAPKQRVSNRDLRRRRRRQRQ